MRRSAHIVLACVTLLAVASPSPGQQQGAQETLHQLHHTSFTSKDGLYGQVQALAQTADGYLWVGTSQGLYRFDGAVFESYTPEQGVLPDSAVTALLAEPDGSLWIGFQYAAVTHLVSGVATTYTEKDGYPYGATRRLARTSDGAIWAAVTGSLVRFDGTTWHKIRADWNYPGKSAWGMLVDRQGTLWVGTSAQLVYLPAGSRTFLDGGFAGTFIVAFAQALNGTLWFSDGMHEVVQSFCSPLERGTCKDPASKVPIGAWAVLFPKLGGAWFATEKRGVRRMNVDTVFRAQAAAAGDVTAESFGKVDSLSDPFCRLLFEDREGNVWSGTEGGLDRFRYRNLLWYATDLNNGRLVAGEHELPWLVSVARSGPHQLPGDTPISPALKPQLRSLDAVTRDANGTVWLANDKGIFRWQAGTMQKIPPPSPTVHGAVYALAVDKQETAWISVSGHGEFSYRDGVWKHIDVPAAHPDITPSFAYVDAANRTWLAYDARHLVSMIVDGRVQTFTEADGLSVGSPLVITGDDRHVWVGGSRGVAYFDGSKFHSLSDRPSDDLSRAFGVLTTPENDLWLSTPQRIVHISNYALKLCMVQACSDDKFERWDLTSDLPEPLFAPTSLFQSALSFRGADGRLWFVTVGGVAVIDPRMILRNAIAPRVEIRSVSVDGKRYTARRDLTFQTRIGSMQIDYTAPSLRLPERVRFKYRLEHVDREWQDAGTRRQANYGNLAPGRYVFQVIACNEDGVWSEAGRGIALIVRPAFYQTTWFMLLCVVLALCMVWLVYHLRVQKLMHRSNELMMERASERERMAQDLHDTFLQSIQGLILKFQMATGKLRTDDPARPLFETTLTQSDAVLLEGRRLVDNLHTNQSSADALVEGLQGTAAELQSVYPGQFLLKSNGTPRELNMIASTEILSIGREALTNAFRHARATQIHAEILYTQRDVQLTVSDDGCGISQEILERGFRTGHWGLRSMQERAKRLGSRCKIASSPERGTCVRVAAPALLVYSHKPDDLMLRLRKVLLQYYRRFKRE